MRNIGSLAHAVEQRVNQTVNRGFLHGWKENTITDNLLADIRDLLRSARLEEMTGVLSFSCEAYKYTGRNMEPTYGDIGAIVEIKYEDKTELQGVAFLEAKIRNKGNGRYQAFKPKQIRDIHGNAPFAQLLLYDFEPARKHWANVDLPYRQFCDVCYPDLRNGARRNMLLGPSEQSNAIVIPSNIVAAKGHLDTSLYKFALPFSYQLCFRYLLGFDLHFAKAPLTSALEYALEQSPRHLMRIAVRYGDTPDDQDLTIQDDRYLLLGRAQD